MRSCLALIIAFSTLAGAACDNGNTGKLPTCTPPSVTNIAGLLHGYPCTKNEECKYGFCDLQSLSTGGAFGVGERMSMPGSLLGVIFMALLVAPSLLRMFTNS